MALIPLSEAREVVLGPLEPLEEVEVPLAEALGAVLAETVTAPEPVPPFANSAMDGYAVRSADTRDAPVRLKVVGELPAGTAPDTPVGPGEAIRIMTGAPVPPGADAVVMVEDTEPAGEGEVLIRVAVEPGTHVRPAGDDLPAGAEVVAAGTVLGPAHLGLLATVGRLRVAVHRPPVVGVLSTGSELVEGPGPLAPGMIRDANRHSLLALVRRAGAVPVDLGLLPDDEDRITAAVRSAVARCDLVLTSGGVSVGDYDYVTAVIDRLGALRWMQIAIKPAKPLAVGRVDGTLVLGLPGNPVSSMVSFELFARPAIRRLAGHPRPVPEPVRAVAPEGLRRHPDGKTHFLRVSAGVSPSGVLEVRSAGGQGSHQLAAVAAAHGLAVVPDGDGVPPGGTCEVLLWELPG